MRQAVIKKPAASSNNRDKAIDLITLVSEDIITKVISKNTLSPEDQELADSEEFKDAIFKFILAETLKYALNNNSGYYRQEFAQAVQSSQDLEEVMAKLIVECSLNPGLAKEILDGLCIAYIAKCNQLGIEADESFIHLLFANLNS